MENYTRPKHEILARITEIETQLAVIQNKIQEQLQMPFFERQFNICRFLSIEKKIYQASLRELKWTLNESH